MNNKNQVFSISRWLGALLLFMLSIITVGLLIWASNKGFDITDEGIYLLASQFPMEVKSSPTAFYMFTAGLYAIAGHSLVVLRLLGLFLMVGSASLLFYGLYRLLNGLRLKFLTDFDVLIVAWTIVVFGAIVYYVIMFPTPNYNLLTSVAINTASGFLFLGLALLGDNSTQYKKSVAAFLGAGLCIGVAFFVKFTTGISLLFLFSTILVLWPIKPPITKVKNIISVGIGMLIWIFIYFAFIQSPDSWWRIFKGGIESGVLINPAYGWQSLQRYYVECSDLLEEIFRVFWKFYVAVIIGLAVLLWLRRLKKDNPYFLFVLLLILFAAITMKSYSSKYYLGGVQHLVDLRYFYSAWLLTFLLAVMVTLIYQWESLGRWWIDAWSRLILIGASLLLIPFTGLIGTGNNITFIMIFYMAPWFGLYMLLLIVLASLLNARWIASCGALIIVLFVCAQVIYGGAIFPYRLNAGMLEQTVSTEIGMPLSHLKLDPATSDFFNRMRGVAQAHGFKPGDDVLAFCDMAGVVFSLGGRSPSTTHYTSRYEGSLAVNERALSLIPKERIQKAFILQNASGRAGFPDLTKFGIDFPGDYILCGEAIWPLDNDLVRLWKPKGHTVLRSHFQNN